MKRSVTRHRPHCAKLALARPPYSLSFRRASEARQEESAVPATGRNSIPSPCHLAATNVLGISRRTRVKREPDREGLRRPFFRNRHLALPRKDPGHNDDIGRHRDHDRGEASVQWQLKILATGCARY